MKATSTGNVYIDKSGRMIASICLNGKQHLKRVKSKEQARQWFLCLQTNNTAAADLTFQELTDSANALTMLRNAGIEMKLEEVVSEWLKGKSRSKVRELVTFSTAIPQYLERSVARIGRNTLKDYRLMLNKFMGIVGAESPVSEFRKPDALTFLDRFLDKPSTWGAYKRTLSRFFTECVRMEWTEANPFLGLDAPRVKPPDRQFLTVEEARKALRSVAKRQPKLIHFMTLGLFAGIRPVESLRLTSKHVNLETGYIHMTADIVKSHSYKERVVPINSTLREWLVKFPFGEKPVPSGNICQVDKEIRECADLDHWSRTKDNLRHSFATYQFALSNNSAETAAICGHAEAIAMKHYRGRVTREEAQRYFALLPSLLRA